MSTRHEPPDVAILAARITGADPNIRPDVRDAAYLADAVSEREQRLGPRVGDFVQVTGGELCRFTHAYDDSLQTTVRGGKFGEGSHYLTESGRISYSGALDPPIQRCRLVLTDEARLGRVWFFHHGIGQAHSAVYAQIPCRVYRELGEAEPRSV